MLLIAEECLGALPLQQLSFCQKYRELETEVLKEFQARVRASEVLDALGNDVESNLRANDNAVRIPAIGLQASLLAKARSVYRRTCGPQYFASGSCRKTSTLRLHDDCTSRDMFRPAVAKEFCADSPLAKAR